MKYYSIILSILILSFVFSCNEDDLSNEYTFNVSATIADHNPHSKIDYTLEIIAKDAPLGNVQWSKIIDLRKTDKVFIPKKFKHYTFKASKPGFIPHVQHFIAEELPNNLSFEFIPESLEGFVTYKSPDNKVTIYLPDDENRCKLYTRFDFAEGCNLLYIYANKSSWDNEGLGLSEYVLKEFLPKKNSVSPNGLNVNIFDNQPFAEAIDYCSEVDLTISPIATELADVNFSTYTRLDYMNINNGRIELFFPFHDWIGINNQ